MGEQIYSLFEDLGQEPIEVRLVGQVTSCRACTWFWEKKPYGPYPAFDFLEDYPEVIREGQWPANTNRESPFHFLDGRCAKQALIVPQILHGCRKAPIVTVGINPNLTGFWPGVKGAEWAYPLFSNFARCAYYYRHRTLFQESLALDFVGQHLAKEGRLVAKGDGYVKSVQREMASREMTITLVYTYPALGEETIERDWDVEHHYVLLYDPVADEPETPQFKKGDLLGGILALPGNECTGLFRNFVDYYERFVPILNRFASFLNSQGLEPNLQMAEDVCQLDMVACATPGWSSQYEIDKEEVIQQCLNVNSWVIKQLLQIQPAVIVFSGRSAFQMFYDILGKAIHPTIDPTWEVYGLLGHTMYVPHYLEIDVPSDGGRVSFRSRVVISPHFSYSDNFVPHSRFSREEWTKFEADFPEALKALKADDRVKEPGRNDYTPVVVENLSESFKVSYPEAVATLLSRLFEASSMIARVLEQEFIVGNLTIDAQTNHLTRAGGPCNFCTNAVWQFPEGCPYGKPGMSFKPRVAIDKTVASLLEGCQQG